MWARMQKDRNQRSQRGSVFNLGDAAGPSESLTHRGQALGSDYRHDDDVQSNDDKDDDLDAEVVDKLHFGGGTRDNRLAHPQVQTHTLHYPNTHTPCYLSSPLGSRSNCSCGTFTVRYEYRVSGRCLYRQGAVPCLVKAF